MSTYAMHVAKTGLNSQQTKMQVIANNLPMSIPPALRQIGQTLKLALPDYPSGG